jgi:hypothetical protein
MIITTSSSSPLPLVNSFFTIASPLHPLVACLALYFKSSSLLFISIPLSPFYQAHSMLLTLQSNSTSSSSSSSSSSTRTTSQSNQISLSSQRTTSYLNNPTSSHPSYGHTSSTASVASHTQGMSSYLEGFDKKMGSGSSST